MAISALLKDITPDYQATLTPQQAEKELEHFTFAGAGWYITELGSMLVVATDTENQFVFNIFYNRDPRTLFAAIVGAPVHTPEVKTATDRPSNFIYWIVMTVLWAACLFVGLKWGFRAEIPVFILMLAWPYLIKWFDNKGKKNGTRKA
jgi:hypothetical protein